MTISDLRAPVHRLPFCLTTGNDSETLEQCLLETLFKVRTQPRKDEFK